MTALSKFKPGNQRIAAIVIPLICLLVAALLFLPQWGRARAVAQDLTKVNGQIHQKEVELGLTNPGQQARQVSAAMATTEEPVEFLKELAKLVTESGNRLVLVRNMAPVSSPGKAANPGEPSKPSTVEVRQVQNEVTVQGTFEQIWRLLVSLENYRRLLSVSSCKVTVSQDGFPQLQANFVLTRYVVGPQPAPTSQ